MVGVTGFERGMEDDVQVAVVCNHDVLIATVHLNGEPTKVIRIELAGGLYADVDLVVLYLGKGDLRLLGGRGGIFPLQRFLLVEHVYLCDWTMCSAFL